MPDVALDTQSNPDSTTSTQVSTKKRRLNLYAGPGFGFASISPYQSSFVPSRKRVAVTSTATSPILPQRDTMEKPTDQPSLFSLVENDASKQNTLSLSTLFLWYHKHVGMV